MRRPGGAPRTPQNNGSDSMALMKGADLIKVLPRVVKRSFQPTRVDMLPLALRQATTTMLSGRPGPVNVDVPFNVFQEEDDVEVPPASPKLGAQRSGASPDDIAAALDL